ncbi:hypothetical protein CspHIS471_0600670 [Cutaneotrichosporon sp. HIS471]|nr:hypothetical protein CspHIS471_0600670 [Cutaneotrichosporon sp. HIS471]
MLALALANLLPLAIAASVPMQAIWQPSVGTPWQIVLSKTVDPRVTIRPNVRVWDVDLFDTPASTIASLQRQGKKVICYFSAGTYESWRDDADQWSEADLGQNMTDWEGERWADVRASSVRKVMEKRIALARQKGCDAIDPDNVDAYNNHNGVGVTDGSRGVLTEADAVDFVFFLAHVASTYRMATGLKNAGAIIPEVIDVVQFSVNEQCATHGECDVFQDFINVGKPVFHIEYPTDEMSVSKLCRGGRFSTVLKDMDLSGMVTYCDGSEATTQTL